jgi:hypothetical protein
MTEHKAKPEVWAAVERWCKNEMDVLNCTLELRARVEALEAAQRSTQVNADIGRRPWAAMSFRGVMLLPPIDCADPDSWIAERIYEMGFVDGKIATTGNAAQQKGTAKPATRLHSYRVENSALPIEEWGKGHTIVDSAKPPVTQDRAEDAPESSDSLVSELARVLVTCDPNADLDDWAAEATAGMANTIADWLDQQELHSAAMRLRMEVGQ